METSPIPGRPDLVLAICDYELNWCGFFGVYCVSGGRVRWQARVPKDISEQSVHRVRALLLRGFRNPIIEVFGQTHMGNGNIYLFELRDRELILLFQTRAVDFHREKFTFQDGTLSPKYSDLNGDGYADLVLEGIVEEWGDEPAAVIHREPLRQVFIWDARLKQFCEDVSSRVGVAEYYD